MKVNGDIILQSNGTYELQLVDTIERISRAPRGQRLGIIVNGVSSLANAVGMSDCVEREIREDVYALCRQHNIAV